MGLGDRGLSLTLLEEVLKVPIAEPPEQGKERLCSHPAPPLRLFFFFPQVGLSRSEVPEAIDLVLCPLSSAFSPAVRWSQIRTVLFRLPSL